MNFAEKVEREFFKRFNEKPVIVRSPGRVNLIGEHTDYNLGFVLPGAIDKAIYFAVSARKDNICNLFAADLMDSCSFSINEIKKSSNGWANYLIGIVDQLIKSGYKLNGFNCVFGGDIPIGAGLSSSAAIEAGLAFSLSNIFNLNVPMLDIVKIAQKSENEFVGVNCGIMDQFINIFGKDGNLLRIDCRTLEYEYFPFDFKNISIVLFDTKVSHSLASSEYNQRRMECSAGVSVISKKHNFVKSLRDVSKDLLSEFETALDPVIYKRCKYVVEENDRLLDACKALINKDLKVFGELMYRTHEGLSKDYEVSCEELDFLVELTMDNPKIYGARMMGGGFGGCTINLIENDSVEEISKHISSEYKNKFNIDPKIYVTKINGGTGIMTV